MNKSTAQCHLTASHPLLLLSHTDPYIRVRYYYYYYYYHYYCYCYCHSYCYTLLLLLLQLLLLLLLLLKRKKLHEYVSKLRHAKDTVCIILKPKKPLHFLHV